MKLSNMVGSVAAVDAYPFATILLVFFSSPRREEIVVIHEAVFESKGASLSLSKHLTTPSEEIFLNPREGEGLTAHCSKVNTTIKARKSFFKHLILSPSILIQLNQPRDN
ncbi:hypothetical protein ACFX16_000637 [Malus domestica]